MKAILDKYNSDFIKNNIDNDIIENYIKKYKSNEYDKYLTDNVEYETLQALISNRENILSWYNFQDSNVLELSSGYGELTLSILKTAGKLVCVEKNKFRAEASSIRYKDLENLTIIASNNLDDINFNEKFDFIIVKDNLEDLDKIKEILNENGTILLLINNKYGVSNFGKEREYKNLYNEKIGLFNLKEIENKLKENNFINYKMFYPLPNYYNTNIIFSDDYMPSANNSKIINNSIVNKNDFSVINEFNVLKQVTDDGYFKYFTNSYLIEINPKSKEKFIGFNNIRKEEFRLCTKIYSENVIKEVITKKAEKHILNIKNNNESLKQLGFDIIDEFKENKIYSKFINKNTFDQILVEKFKNNNIDLAIELINKWFEVIKNNLKNEKSESINSKFEDDYSGDELNVVKNLYIDLVFENTFYIDNKFLFYDQEWCLQDLPLEFILYRSINNLIIYNSEILQNIKSEEIFEKIGIASYINLFEKIERYFQKYVIDENIQKFYDKKSVSELEKIKDELGLYKAENNKKEKYITFLENTIKEKEKLITILEEKTKIQEERIKENNDVMAEKKGFFSIIKKLIK